MIDINAEDVLTLRDAAKVLPRRRRGRKPHLSTLVRWSICGIRGVRLETIRVGGTLCTSREAHQRFCERLSSPHESPSRPSATRQRSVQKAKKELDDAGI